MIYGYLHSERYTVVVNAKFKQVSQRKDDTP